jgi:lysophospholipase L1-like esterase
MLRPAIFLAIAVVALAGCGDEDAAPASSAGRTVVAALGDSITAGSPRWDPNPAIRAQIGSQLDPRSQYEYWAERALPGTDFRNCGVPGERTDEIAVRLEACARGADVLIVQGGVNDIGQGLGPSEIAPRLRAMVRHGRRLGMRVAIVELLPWTGGYPDSAGPIRRLNRRIAMLARAEGARLIPWYRVLEDPARPGRMVPALTTDNAHPSIAGYRRLGEAVDLP